MRFKLLQIKGQSVVGRNKNIDGRLSDEEFCRSQCEDLDSYIRQLRRDQHSIVIREINFADYISCSCSQHGEITKGHVLIQKDCAYLISMTP
jgi:hypothetical protein